MYFFEYLKKSWWLQKAVEVQAKFVYQCVLTLIWCRDLMLKWLFNKVIRKSHSVFFFFFCSYCSNLKGLLTLAPAACAGIQVVWVESVGSVHFGQQLSDMHHLWSTSHTVNILIPVESILLKKEVNFGIKMQIEEEHTRNCANISKHSHNTNISSDVPSCSRQGFLSGRWGEQTPCAESQTQPGCCCLLTPNPSYDQHRWKRRSEFVKYNAKKFFKSERAESLALKLIFKKILNKLSAVFFSTTT